MAIHDQARAGELPRKITSNLDQVCTYLRASGANTDHNVVVYRDFDRVTGAMTIDVGVQVESVLPANGRVVPVTTPGGVVVTTVHLGPYDKLGEASGALHEFCKTRDHPIAGPTWEGVRLDQRPSKMLQSSPISSGQWDLARHGDGRH